MQDPVANNHRYSEILDYHNIEAGVGNMEDHFNNGQPQQ